MKDGGGSCYRLYLPECTVQWHAGPEGRMPRII
jgi:hypothetical protein